MQRLFDSEARYAVVDREWWGKRKDPSRPILSTLLSAFVPVRLYGSMVILERDSSAERLRMHAIARRIRRHRIGPGDTRALRELLRKRPDDPVAHQLLGELLIEQRQFRAAAASLEAALRLDPANPELQARLEGIPSRKLR